MTTPDRAPLASRLESAIREIPGVAQVFPARDSLRSVMSDSPVATRNTDVGLAVAVAIGVLATHSAARSAQLAHEVITRIVTEHGPLAQIRVTVVQVEAS